MQKWCDDINKINRIDKRDWKEIEIIIYWCQKDKFWQNNILSANKLRKQFETLALKFKNSNKYTTYENVKNIDDWRDPFTNEHLK